MEKISELYRGCRSYRKFKQEKISQEILHEIAETARLRSSGMNAQPLRFVVISEPEKVAAVQPCLTWAVKLPKEIGTPVADEQPTAFIIVLGPVKTDTIADIDVGIALDTMAITAWQHGIGSCIIAAVDRKKIADIITIPDALSVKMVLALGYPSHKSTIVEPDEEHGLSYYADDEKNLYVPKLSSDEVIKYM